MEIDRILDLGTGSGCLAVAAAHYCPGVLVDAVDVSPEALEVARVNVAEHNLGERVRVIESNLFDALEDCYQVIISNPPYVPESRIGELPREYSHEPDLALRIRSAERLLSEIKADLLTPPTTTTSAILHIKS